MQVTRTSKNHSTRVLRLATAGASIAVWAVAILAADSAGARPADPPVAGAVSVSEDLRVAKKATAKYRSVKQAEKAGYVREGGCVSSPDGAMGIHYVNPRLARDKKLDPRRPEVLLYLPRANRRLRLVGVEYFVAAADQDPPIDDADRPRIFGRVLDGPMEGHGPGMPFHYDLHVWLWADNPAGRFAPFNPDLSCAS